MVKKWWKQMTDRIRGRQAEPAQPEETDVLWPEPQLRDLAQVQIKDVPDDLEAGPGGLSRWMLRRQLSPQVESCIEQLTQSNEKLISTLEKISQVSQAQDQQLEQIGRNQEKFVTVLDRHGKTLETMLQEFHRLASAADRLAMAIESVPKISREQSEKLAAIEDQLHNDAQTDRALLASIDVLGRHMASMARYAETQQTNKEELTKNIAQQIQPLVDLGQKQRLFTKINMILNMIIALGMLGFLAFAIMQFFMKRSL